MHMRKFILALVSLAATLSFTLAVMPVQAQSTNPLQGAQNQLGTFAPSLGYGGDTQGTQLMKTIGAIIQFALGFMGIVFVLLIIYSGFLWMTAGGDTKKVESAKNIIKNCIIGLIIMVLAYSITTFVFANLTKAVNSTT